MASALQTPPSNGTACREIFLYSEEERRLLESCRRGDRASQQRLYEQHCEKVYRLMCRMAGAPHADDLTQQVFLCVFHKFDKFHGRSSFSTWLYRLASNEALQFLRTRRRSRHQPIRTDLADTAMDGPLQLERRDALEWALARLDPQLRMILLLREVEELSYCEIAMALDLAEGTVASRLNRARRCMAALLTDGDRIKFTIA